MNVMILAAGEGTRFRPYTLTTPKPAIPFLGIPLACYTLSLIREIKLKKIVVNTYHLPEKITELYKSLPIDQNHLSFSHEKEIILGSGGGLGQARPLLKRDENVLMMNADEVILPHKPRVIDQLIKYHQTTNALATLLTTTHSEVGTKFGGVWVDAHNKVYGFGMGQPFFTHDLNAQHFMGVQLLSYKIFNYIDSEKPSNILHDVLIKAIKAGEKVNTLHITCDWFETGNLQDYNIATQKCIEILESSSKSYHANFLRETLDYYSPGWSLETIKKLQL